MNIIAFSGRKQAGKDTGSRYLAEMVSPSFEKISFFSFADPLKKFLIDWFELPYNSMYGTDDEKNELTTYRWENLPFSISKGRIGRMSGRQILQIWGSDLMREFWPDVHANQLRKVLKQWKESLSMYGMHGIGFITDVRFPNEVYTVLDLGGKVIRLTRSPFGEDAHKSEVALENFPWDLTLNCHVLDNRNLTLDEYRSKLVELAPTLIPSAFERC